MNLNQYLIVGLTALFSAGLVAQTATGTPVTPTPVTGSGLTPVDAPASPLPSLRDRSSQSTLTYFEGLFMDVDVTSSHALVATNEGCQIWDISNPATLTRLCNLQMKNNDFPYKPADPHNSKPIQGGAIAPGGSIAALSGFNDVGVILMDISNKNQPRIVYQDNKKGNNTGYMYCTSINGRDYLFWPYGHNVGGVDPMPGGVRVYDLTAAAALTTPVVGELTTPDGVYIKTFGGQHWYHDVHGVDQYLVASTELWGSRGLEFYDVSNPAAPVAKHGSTRPLSGIPCWGTRMWKQGSTYYVATVTLRASNVYRLEIYDCTAVLNGTQTQFGAPLYYAIYPFVVSAGVPISFSRSASGTPYLYLATNATASPQVTQASSEWLLDVSNPAAPLQVGNGAYWTHYHQFAWSRPRRAHFNGDVLYRADLGCFDHHTVSGGGTPVNNKVSVSVQDDTAAEPSANPGVVSLVFNPPTTVQMNITWTLSGTASIGGPNPDYSLSSSHGTASSTGIVGIPAGTPQLNIIITVIDDIIAEGTETVVFTLTGASQGYTVGTPSTGTVNILDDETASANTISAAAQDATAAEPGTDTGRIVLTFNPPTAGITDVSLALSGTATLGSDYSLSASLGTLGTGGVTGVPMGTSSLTITVTVIDDSQFEGTETVTLTVTGGTGGYIAGAPAAGTVNINDDDSTPTNSVSLSLMDANAGEPGNTGAWIITFNPPTAAVTSIGFALTGDAVFGPFEDYLLTASVGTVSATGISGIPAGTTSLVLSLVPEDDAAVEPTEIAMLTLTSVPSPYTIAGGGSAAIQITDNDAAGGFGGGGGSGGGGGCVVISDNAQHVMWALLVAVFAACLRRRRAA